MSTAIDVAITRQEAALARQLAAVEATKALLDLLKAERAKQQTKK